MRRRWGLSLLLALLACAILFGVALLVGGRITGASAAALLVVVLGLLFAARALGPAGGAVDAGDGDGD
jgi:hypothetical protein